MAAALSPYACRLLAVLPTDGRPMTIRRAGHEACLSGVTLTHAGIELERAGFVTSDPSAANRDPNRTAVLRRLALTPRTPHEAA